MTKKEVIEFSIRLIENIIILVKPDPLVKKALLNDKENLEEELKEELENNENN